MPRTCSERLILANAGTRSRIERASVIISRRSKGSERTLTTEFVECNALHAGGHVHLKSRARQIRIELDLRKLQAEIEARCLAADEAHVARQITGEVLVFGAPRRLRRRVVNGGHQTPWAGSGFTVQVDVGRRAGD